MTIDNTTFLVGIVASPMLSGLPSTVSVALHCRCPTTALYSPESLLSTFCRISL